MSGSIAGGRAARDTNYRLYGRDHYVKLGKLGGVAPKRTPGGFAANRELASVAGTIGGLKSRRVSEHPKHKRYYGLKDVDGYELGLAYDHLLEVQRKAQHEREVA